MSRRFFHVGIIWVLSTALGLSAAGRVAAGPIALFTSPGSGALRTGDGFTLGSKFTVGSNNAIVSSLGVFDSTGVALAAATPVDIWDSVGSVVAAATVPQGTADLNQFAYVSISPVTLLAGHSYTLGAYYSSSADPAQLRDHSSTPGTSPDFNSYLAAFTGSNTVGSISDPTGTTSGVAYIGPDFLYVVPEPSTLLLLASGFLLICSRLPNRFLRST